MRLDDLKSPADLKRLPVSGLPALCDELRAALLRKLSDHGGHIGPNLGMVEATVALHYVFDSPRDRIVFDVSHQSYVHKMLTGRMRAFTDPKRYDDVSGYTNPDESEHDCFNVGHTSTSVSLATGLAKGRDLLGLGGNVVAVIGDGSLSGGEAFEGLDNAAALRSNFIVLVNDNEMSIPVNSGGLYDNLKLLRDTDGKAPLNYFRALGLDYVYEERGNDVEALVRVFRKVKDIDHPVAVHIHTQKGQGFLPAMQDRERFHWGFPFDISTGECKVKSSGDDYSSLTGKYLLDTMKDMPGLIALTASMPMTFGFTPSMRETAGRQFVDVGICEEQAIAMASGIGKAGGCAVFGINSTFVQRVYDQVMQDLCLNGSHAVLLIFYTGLFGLNDVTHTGLQDIAMLSNIPGLTYLSPSGKEEYMAMLDWAVKRADGPMAIRVPGRMTSTGKPDTTDYGAGVKSEIVRKGSRVAFLGLGTFLKEAMQAADLLERRAGLRATVINPKFISSLDTGLLESLKKDHELVITLEDGIAEGGFGAKVALFYADSDMKTLCRGARKEFVDRFAADELVKSLRMTPGQLADDALARLR